MNRLSIDRRTQAINCLVEGNSIRSTERMTGIHRDTIMRLLIEVGSGCSVLMDTHMRDLSCERPTSAGSQRVAEVRSLHQRRCFWANCSRLK